MEKTGQKGTIDYAFDQGGNVLYQQEGSDYTENVYVLGKHFARVDGNLDNPGQITKYFYETDHLGSTVAVTDANGNKVWDTEYTPFGDRAVITGSLAGAIDFTGKDLDEDTGLYYYNARYAYDQELGRFMSEDAIADPKNPNLYTYCANNPLTNVDPSGNEWYNNWGDFCNTVSNWFNGNSSSNNNDSNNNNNDNNNDNQNWKLESVKTSEKTVSVTTYQSKIYTFTNTNGETLKTEEYTSSDGTKHYTNVVTNQKGYVIEDYNYSVDSSGKSLCNMES